MTKQDKINKSSQNTTGFAQTSHDVRVVAANFIFMTFDGEPRAQ